MQCFADIMYDLEILHSSRFEILCLLCFLFPPGEGALCSIPIENILAVERLEEESFKMKNVRIQKSPNIKSLQFWLFGINLLLLTAPPPPLPDVPGYSTRASALHTGQQLCGGTWLDRHPDQSQPVQSQTLKHLPPFSLPQRPLALLQALCRHGTWVHTLHWVREVAKMCPGSCPFFAFFSLHFIPHACVSVVYQQTSSWT